MSITNANGPQSASPDTRRRLERRAEVVKSRLLRHIDALDERRHQVTDLGHKAKEVGQRLAGVVAGGALLVGGVIGLAVWGLRARKNRRLENRVAKAFAPLRRATQPSLLSEAVRRAVLTLVPLLIGQVASRVTKRALPTPRERLTERRLERGVV